ncbi:MAG: alpha/beta hydrolase [Solirubrobacterales bacterium]
MALSKVEEETLLIGGVPVFCRRVEGAGKPTVYVHGNPTSSEDWLPFLTRGGAALALDLPGWGRSGRPDPTRFDYTMHGLSAFHDRCLEALGIGEHNLVVHDWGGLALIGAQRDPASVRSLVVLNAVPLLPGYRWHPVARIWRRRGVGEAFNAIATRRATAMLLRQARGDRSPMPDEFVDMVWRSWDRGCRRAVLRLYRDADPPRLAEAGARLARLRCPALVLWGERDPYISAAFGRAYAERLPGGRYEGLESAGHWPWVDDPGVVERVLSFLAEA